MIPLVMPNFAARIPIEDEKSGAFLHDRTRLPASPVKSATDWAKSNQGSILGVVFALGFSALAFQTRSSWHTHRDWVIPVTTPFLAIGGVCLGHLVGRREIKALIPGLAAIGVALVLTVLNIVRSLSTSGQDNLRDILSILTTIAIIVAIAALTFATVQVELKRPTKAPKPEM